MPRDVAEEPDPTPFVFRRRGLLFGLCFVVSIPLGVLLGQLRAFQSLEGILSLPRPLLVGASGPAPGLSPLFLVPLAFFVLAAALRGWGTSYLRGHVMIDTRMHSDRLIVAGPFRWVRNPLYLGNLAMAIGFGLFFPPPTMLLLLLSMGTLGVLLARAEAEGLRRRFGAQYDAYAAKVHAFIPKPPPADLPSGSDVAPDWRNGYGTESWSAVMGLYLVALSLHWKWVAAVLGIATAIGAWWRLGLRRRKTA